MLALAAATAGCNSTALMQRMVTQKAMEYEKHPTEYNLTDLAHCYGELLEAQRGDTVRPGWFADYGVALAMLGKHSEANRMLNNEVMLYPNAQRYVRQLKLQLVPEYLSDTVSDTSTIYIIDLQKTERESTPLNAKDSAMQAKALQREMREQQKRQRAEAKQAAANERDLIKSIRAKEKEQRDQERSEAKTARENAKKEAAKAKERAQKEAAKEREALRKERQREREAAREKRNRERAADQNEGQKENEE